MPSDHLRLLVELLRPCGVELARRWLAALLVAPAHEREAIVASVERRMTELYGHGRGEEPRLIDTVSPPVQRDGYVEQIVRTYEAAPPTAPAKPAAKTGKAPRARPAG